MNNNEWISINDSLPNKAGVYTVLTADGKEYDEVYMDLFGNGKKIFLRQNVTHWKEKTMSECKDCIHYKACMHLIDIDKEELTVCEHFKPNTNTATTKRGIWRKHDMGFAAEYKCSLCGYMYCEADPTYPPEKYCCKCGAENG